MKLDTTDVKGYSASCTYRRPTPIRERTELYYLDPENCSLISKRTCNLTHSRDHERTIHSIIGFSQLREYHVRTVTTFAGLSRVNISICFAVGTTNILAACMRYARDGGHYNEIVRREILYIGPHIAARSHCS